MRGLALLLGLLTACASGAAAEKQAQLDAMAMACGLPKGALLLESGGNVTLRLPHGANLTRTECVLKKIFASEFASKFGFEGNGMRTDANSN